MSAQRLFTIALIGAALLTAHRTFGSPPDLNAGVGEAVGEAVAEATHLAQLRSAFGSAGAFVVGPFVRSMTLDTERMVGDLEPALGRARAPDARRARKLKDLIVRLDSAAQTSLADGRPIEALKQAAEGRALVSDIRQILAEETAFR